MFDLAINSKLSGCDVVNIRIGELVSGGQVRARALVIQQKTGRPVLFEPLEPARTSIRNWFERRGGSLDEPAFPSRIDSADDRYLSGELAGQVEVRHYARMQEMWIDLSLNRLDGALGSVRTARAAFLETPLGDGFAFAGPPIENDTYFGEGKGIVVREGDVSLKRALNVALRTMRRDGSYQQIWNRTLGDSQGTERPQEAEWQIDR